MSAGGYGDARAGNHVNAARSHAWRGRVVAGVALLAGVGVLGYMELPARTHKAAVPHAVASATTVAPLPEPSKVDSATLSGPATFPGPDGTESRQIQLENAKPGSTDWQIPGGTSTTAIQGYADHVYAEVGDNVGLYVSTRATHFRVDAYRMGYYGGAGARLVWQSGDLDGAVQPLCQLTDPTNTFTCDDWTQSLTFQVTPQFVQGDYLLKLTSTGKGGGQSYVPLTIWDPSSHGAYLIKNDVFTWQAWNSFGGYDFYTGQGRCSREEYPVCNRARVVSFDRPYGEGSGAGEFLGNEYPLVRFAEQHNLDVSYATDLTVQEHPGLLLNHRTMLSLGHDECWSRVERLAAVKAEAHGVNMVFFAASPILRHVRLESSPLGADRDEVDYRSSSEDPLSGKADPLDVTGNTWSSPPANWSADSFVGAGYAGFLEPDADPVDFTVADGSSWIFAGTGLHTGSKIPDLLRSDFDHFETSTHPDGEEILAHSRIPLGDAQSLIGSRRGDVYSDMTYYSDPTSGAGVIDTGTNNWIPSMVECPKGDYCVAPILEQITGNLLKVFGAGPAGRVEPPVSNWTDFY